MDETTLTNQNEDYEYFKEQYPNWYWSYNVEPAILQWWWLSFKSMLDMVTHSSSSLPTVASGVEYQNALTTQGQAKKLNMRAEADCLDLNNDVCDYQAAIDDPHSCCTAVIIVRTFWDGMT